MRALVTGDSWHTEVRESRKEKGISQQKMAKSTGIRQPRISQIENGLVDPKLSEILSISQVLDIALLVSPRKFVEEMEYTLKECLMIDSRDKLPRSIPQAILGDRYYA